MDVRGRSEGLGERLLAADRKQLGALLEASIGELSAEDAVQALRNPFLDGRGLALLLAEERLLGSYRLRRELTVHRLTPEPRAAQLLATLYWRDLADVQRDARISPRLRRIAEGHLASRLPSLSLGEKVALARRATGGLLEELGAQRAPRVVAAMLENPRCTEGVVTRLAGRAGTPADVLQIILQSRRWSRRPEVRRALCLNPAAPPGLVLPLLPSLGKSDLRRISRGSALAAPVRRRASVLLGEEPP